MKLRGFKMKRKFTTTLDENIIKKAKIIAIEENTSVSKLIEKALNELIKNHDK